MPIYRSVVHDGPAFEMERQIFLLAQAAAHAWSEWMKGQPVHGPGYEPTLLEVYMRELYQQLDKTDIFMGGYHAAKEPK